MKGKGAWELLYRTELSKGSVESGGNPEIMVEASGHSGGGCGVEEWYTFMKSVINNGSAN